MAKPKEGKENEFYLGQIRELKAENRNLKKRIRELEKREHFYDDKDLEDIIDEVIIKKEQCPECFRCTLEDKLVINRHWKQCSICGWRDKAKIL